MAYNHGVKNTDPNFVIDPVTRVITQKSGKTRLMQHDHNSECYGFQIPRFIDGHDMSLCDVSVHYINISSNKTERNSDRYPVTDVTVIGSNVVFSWLVSKNATGYSGTLNFTISFERNTGGVVDYNWHTDIFKGITVSDTIQIDVSEVVESNADILTQWHNALFGIADTEEASIKSVSATEQAAIEAKGAATLATIPEDYTATYNMADNAVRTKADGIIQAAEGELISVKDSSNDHLRGLRIFGKSTQKKTTGTQLCHFPDVESYICEGITWSCKDGVVKVKGTSTAISSSSREIKYNLPIEAGKYYLLGYSSDIMMLCCVTDSEGTLHYYQHVFSLDGTEKSVLIYCQIDSGKTVNETIYPMVSVTDGAEFESYSGGFASPSPDWAQEIESISPSVIVTGKNMFNSEEAKIYNDLGEYPSLGIGVVRDNNIYVTKLGTASFFFGHYIDVVIGKKYTASFVGGTNVNGDPHSLYIYADKPYGTHVLSFTSNGRTAKTFVATTSRIFMGVYVCGTTATNETLTYSDVQLELGEYLTDYEPGVANQMIPVVGGDNLGLDYAVRDDTELYAGVLRVEMNFKTSTDYLIVCKAAPDNIYYTNEKIFTEATYIYPNYGYTTVVVKTRDVFDSDIDLQYTEGEGWLIFKNGKDNAAHSFSDFRIYEASQLGIPGIQVDSVGNYTDENGQQWISDEIDFERGVYIQRIKAHVFNGSESWSQHATVDTLYYVWMEDGALNGMTYPSLCSHYEYESGELANVSRGHRFNNNGSGKAQLFYIKDDQFSSLAELKASLADKYESASPVSIIYALFTPIETPLTEAELAAFKALHTNYPNTTVLNNAGAHMRLKYNADTKLYIDNKFAELAAKMSSNT